jgi:hypothetical protein
MQQRGLGGFERICCLYILQNAGVCVYGCACVCVSVCVCFCGLVPFMFMFLSSFPPRSPKVTMNLWMICWLSATRHPTAACSTALSRATSWSLQLFWMCRPRPRPACFTERNHDKKSTQVEVYDLPEMKKQLYGTSEEKCGTWAGPTAQLSISAALFEN